MTHDEIEAQLRSSAPSCIGSFLVSSGRSVQLNHDVFNTTWSLSCECGADSGQLLGYRLRDFNPEYSGEDMITPIAFKCLNCSKITELLDTDEHGYHAEVGRLEGDTTGDKLRGQGERVQHRCPNCGQESFRMTACFIYWDFDVAEDEPDLPAENFFNEFTLACDCQTCGRESRPLDLGKL